MKIACIGNMNNMIFPICRYLKDYGYECTLFLLDEYVHFLPLADSDNITIEIIELGWNEETFGQISQKKINATFQDFDFFIGTDYSAAYLSKASIQMDIYMPAGSDLFHYPFKTFNSFLPQVWEINKYKCARNQFWGIKNARNLSLDKTNSMIDKYLGIIKPKGKRIPVLPFLYLENGSYPQMALPTYLQVYFEQIKTVDFVIIQHCRQAWNYDKSNLHYKANDVLIRGFAEFTKINKSAVLVLLEYGEHVENSKALIDELQIDINVIWLPKMERKHLMQFIKLADVGVGELGNSWLSYGAVYEILACRATFMGYREDRLYKDEYLELYPMLNAKTKEDVFTQLQFGFSNRDTLNETALKGQDWLNKNALMPSVNIVLKIVKSHRGRKKMPIDCKLALMQPYFFFIKVAGFFRVKLAAK